MNIAKKIIATITTVTCAAWMMGPGIAQATTIAELEALIASLTQQLSQATALLSGLQSGSGGSATVTGCTITSFTNNLKVGSSGQDVKCLQIILNSDASTQVAASGVGSSGNETTYFGPLTKSAVIKFQEKYASEVLTPVGLTKGTGYVGSSTRAKLDPMISTGTGGTGETGGTTTPTTPTTYENKISVAADNPAAVTIAKGAQNVVAMKLNFCAADQANTVSKIILTRSGIAADADISAVKLYDGTTQVGSTQALNTTNHKATFSALNWTISADSCKVLTVKASIASGATAGDTPKFKIASASDITSTVALDGVYPIESNGTTIAGIGTGAVEISTTTSPSGTIVAGTSEQAVVTWKLTASSTEGVKVHSVKITEVGSSVDSDVSNVKLFYASTQLGSTAVSLTNGAATFDFSAAPLEILAGTSKNITAYVDVGTSIGVDDRTIKFEITANTDVTAYGANSGGQVIAYGNTEATDLWPLQGQSMTVALGSLTIQKDTTYSPSAQDYTRGTSDNDMIAIKLSAGANEGVRITYIKLTETQSALGDSDVANITLYDAETGARLVDTTGNTIPAASMVSGYVTFGSYTTGLDTTGLFDIEKSKSKIVLVKADVSSAATVADTRLGFELNNPTTDVKADGLSSGNDLGTSDINAGVTTAVPSTSVNHDIIEKGTLTVSANSNTPAASNYTLGTENYTFAKFDLTSTGEGIKVSQFNVYFATGTGSATTTAADAADVNNVELWDGDTLLGTDSQISSGYAEFAVNLTIEKNKTKVLTVKADIPIGSDAANLRAWIQKPADLTAEGEDSGATVTTSGTWSSITGNLMTKGAPYLTVKAAPTPATKTFIKNTSAAHVATLYFTATNTEDITITKIKIAGISASSSAAGTATTVAAVAASAETGMDVNVMAGSVALYLSGSDTPFTNVLNLEDGTNYDYVDFTGLSLSVPKGTTKVIDVKVKVLDATTTSGDSAVHFYFGIASGTVDVAGSGVDSGVALDSDTISVDSMGVFGQGMKFGSAGTLTVTNDANPPASAVYTTADGAVSLGKWKFTASDEAITLKKVRFDVRNSSSSQAYFTGYAGPSTTSIATSGLQFWYSLNDGATRTCSFGKVAASWTTMTLLAAEITSDCVDLAASYTASDEIKIMPASSSYTSIEIQDTLSTASNTADDLKLGLKYGGTQYVNKTSGADANFGNFYLYDGETLVSTANVTAQTNNAVVFDISSGLSIPVGTKYLTVKSDISPYTAMTEGSTVILSIGSTTATDVEYVTAEGTSGTLAAGSITLDAENAGNEMYLYATKPTLAVTSGSPSGVQTPGTSKKVFEFTVTNAQSLLSMYINAIRFKIESNTSTVMWDKTYTLYKTNDLTTSLGSGVSYANATSTDLSGWVTIYPTAGYEVGSGDTVTYALYGNTSAMNTSSGNEYLTISIDTDNFYWDDGLAANANNKVGGLPATGNTMTF
ncbi:MAG: peptidoglycan-binding domain-containing protein [Candidatus Pacebacteria bacterium]|nr:peptidoglycan-binding domain-containing protein [Candidatus Paceibacterota bacterium]